MANVRVLPDGSHLDMETGSLSNFDVNRERAGLDIAVRMGKFRRVQAAPTAAAPIPNRTQQMTPVAVVPNAQGHPTPMIRPDATLLRPNPFELGLGAMSDSAKRTLLLGGILAAAVGWVWLNNKMSKKKAEAAATSETE